MTGAVAGDLPADVEYLGVDGCPAGWLATGIDEAGGWHVAVFEAFGSLWTSLDRSACEQVLVDVPIGLREDRVRACDEAARDLLGSRWNAVFRTPIERAVDLKRRETDGRDRRPEASAINADETGYGLSAQVWNITDEIAELDDVFAERGLALDGPVREAHPELAFMAFNGQPVAYSKKSRRGRALREAILDDEGVDTGTAVSEAFEAIDGADVGADDVLDATVLAHAARTELVSVPAEPDQEQPRINYPDRAPAWDAQSYFPG